MIRKTERLLITFHTTTAAMAMERLCRAKAVEGRLVPVPGSVSADCGLAWSAAPGSEQQLTALMVENGIWWQGLHRCTL